MKLIIRGGGGTSHLAVKEYAIKEKVKILVCFTDGYSDIENIKWNETPFQTVFVLTESSNKDNLEPYGKVIVMSK